MVLRKEEYVLEMGLEQKTGKRRLEVWNWRPCGDRGMKGLRGKVVGFRKCLEDKEAILRGKVCAFGEVKLRRRLRGV